MVRTLQRLNSLAIVRANEPGYLADGGGLYLQISPAGTKSWIFRFSLNASRRDMGLGPFPAIGLADARLAASKARTALKSGQDPIAVRKAERAAQRATDARSATFKDCATRYIDSHKDGWKNDKHAAQWTATLEAYAYPKFGNVSVAAVDAAMILKALEPIWKTKTETARRVRGRVESILDWATVRGMRTGDNPAKWRGQLQHMLPARPKGSAVRHHPAVAIDDLPAVYARLCESQGMGALALRFVILTAARAGEVVGLKWAEIDMAATTWTVPADRIKAGREHRVPLSREAMEILKASHESRTGDLVFPGWGKGKQLSLMSLTKALWTAGGTAATVHGFRSTFRDWASERTNFPRDVAEMSLAHAIGDKVEAAYRRGDLIKKRAAIMQAWASFATAPRKAENVVQLARAAA